MNLRHKPVILTCFMSLENFKYNLRSLNTCNQYWDEMTPVEGGRHCAQCSKTIIDFSAMSFTEIAIFLSQRKEQTCGYYLPEQVKEIKHSKSKRALAIAASTLLATAAMATEVNSIHTPIEIIDRQHLEMTVDSGFDKIIAAKDSLYFTGRLQYLPEGKKEHSPLAYAAVMIKGTKVGVVTDENGYFRLPYLPENEIKKLYLYYSSVGFEMIETEVVLEGRTSFDMGTTTLQPAPFATEFIIKAKKRSKLNKLWRKITSPFRKK